MMNMSKINTIRLERVSFVRPAGNDTAIVWDQMERGEYPLIAQLIQREFPNIEQIMFVEINPTTQSIRGQMAGGEFCANATRSLAYLLLADKDGAIEMDVSGADTFLMAQVSKNRATINIPLEKKASSIISMKGRQQAVIDMGGIGHIVSFEGDELYETLTSLITDNEERKYTIRKTLESEQYRRFPACGLMLARPRTSGEFDINPFVYVRATGTLYNETACASGSAAVAIAYSFLRKKSIQSLNIFQPSGQAIETSVVYEQNVFDYAAVGGPISVFYDGDIILPNVAGVICK